MEDNQKIAFWQVKWQSDSRRKQAKIVSIIGAALLLVAFSVQPNTFWIVLACASAIAVSGISNVCSTVDYIPPEPNLELIDEKYKLKASGADGINALALIAVFKEQEHVKSERLLMLIGAGFGVISLVIGILSDNVLPIFTSNMLTILFVAWAIKVRSIRVKGFGVEVASKQ